MKVVGWRAWYANHQVFDSRRTDWRDLPKDGVLGVVIYYEGGYREIVDDGDWYYLEDGVPTAVQCEEENGGWVEPPDVDPRDLKRGVTVSSVEYSKIQDEMMEAKQWP